MLLCFCYKQKLIFNRYCNKYFVYSGKKQFISGNESDIYFIYRQGKRYIKQRITFMIFDLNGDHCISSCKILTGSFCNPVSQPLLFPAFFWLQIVQCLFNPSVFLIHYNFGGLLRLNVTHAVPKKSVCNSLPNAVRAVWYTRCGVSRTTFQQALFTMP